jgi:hypothetical protein
MLKDNIATKALEETAFIVGVLLVFLATAGPIGNFLFGVGSS